MGLFVQASFKSLSKKNSVRSDVRGTGIGIIRAPSSYQTSKAVRCSMSYDSAWLGCEFELRIANRNNLFGTRTVTAPKTEPRSTGIRRDFEEGSGGVGLLFRTVFRTAVIIRTQAGRPRGQFLKEKPKRTTGHGGTTATANDLSGSKPGKPAVFLVTANDNGAPLPHSSYGLGLSCSAHCLSAET